MIGERGGGACEGNTSNLGLSVSWVSALKAFPCKGRLTRKPNSPLNPNFQNNILKRKGAADRIGDPQKHIQYCFTLTDTFSSSSIRTSLGSTTRHS